MPNIWPQTGVDSTSQKNSLRNLNQPILFNSLHVPRFPFPGIFFEKNAIQLHLSKKKSARNVEWHTTTSQGVRLLELLDATEKSPFLSASILVPFAIRQHLGDS